jgi:hypothetical protein
VTSEIRSRRSGSTWSQGRDLGGQIQALRADMEAQGRDLGGQIQALRADMQAQGRDLAGQIQALRTDMQRQGRDIEQRLTIRLGGMLAASIAIVAVLVRLL